MDKRTTKSRALIAMILSFTSVFVGLTAGCTKNPKVPIRYIAGFIAVSASVHKSLEAHRTSQQLIQSLENGWNVSRRYNGTPYKKVYGKPYIIVYIPSKKHVKQVVVQRALGDHGGQVVSIDPKTNALELSQKTIEHMLNNKSYQMLCIILLNR